MLCIAIPTLPAKATPLLGVHDADIQPQCPVVEMVGGGMEGVPNSESPSLNKGQCGALKIKG